MLYAKELLLPANGSAGAPESTEINLTYGILKRIEVTFPDGCCGFARVAIDKNNTQICPVNDGEWLRSNAETIVSNEHILLNERPYTIKLRGYNLDDTYQHRIIFRFEVDSDAGVLTQGTLNNLLDQARELNNMV